MHILALCAAALLAAAPTALADSLTISAPADALEDSPITVVVSGWADGPSELGVDWSHGNDCRSATGSGDILAELVDGEFSFTVRTGRELPGVSTLCAEMDPDDDERDDVWASAPVAVRSNVASVAISGPAAMPVRRALGIELTGATELGREVRLEVLPGSACGTDVSGWLDGAQFQWDADLVPGAFTVRAPVRLTEYGRYSLCAFVVEDTGLAADRVEAAAGRPILVTPACTAGWRRVWAARQRLARARDLLDRAWRSTAALRASVRRAGRELRQARGHRHRACGGGT